MIEPTDIDICAFGECCMFLKDVCSIGVVKSFIAHFLRKATNDLCIWQRLPRRLNHFFEVTDPSFCVGHGAFLFQPGRRRKNYISKANGFWFVTYLLHYYELCLS